MDLFPIFLKISARPCIVIGAGHLAESKIESLLAANARITVIVNTGTEAMLAANPNRALALNADKAAPFGLVISVMDVLKEANVRNVPAFTEQKEQ